MSKKINSLKLKLDKLEKQYEKFKEEHSIHKFKSDFISCKKCGSKINLSFFEGEKCPVCENDLRSINILNKINKYKEDIKNLEDEICNTEAFELRKSVKNYTLSERTCLTNADKKILDYLKSIYKDNFRYAKATESKDYIFVECEDYNHSIKYFSAWFDGFLFDKSGNFISSNKTFVKGSAYSDFFIDEIDFDGKNFRLFVRSCISPYSKCTDYYDAVWIINILDNKNFTVEKNPFIFSRRHSERDYPINNKFFSNDFGTYYMFEDIQGYIPSEVSLNANLREKLKNK